MGDTKDVNVVRATSVDLGRDYGVSAGSSSSRSHVHPEIVAEVDKSSPNEGAQMTLAEEPMKQKGVRAKLAFFKTRDFWFILALGQILAVCITGTNTLTTLMVIQGTSVPAFQTLLNYILLNIVYTGYTIYKYGWKKWGNMVVKDGWKCMHALNLTLAEQEPDQYWQTSSSPSSTSKATTSPSSPTATRQSCPPNSSTSGPSSS